MAKFENLVGKTILSFEVAEDKSNIRFVCDDGKKYILYHESGCFESVLVEDICGDIKDIIGQQLILSEEVISNQNPSDAKKKDYQDSFTWTFYKLGTAKGGITIRWYGESNGCYSESVTFAEA